MALRKAGKLAQRPRPIAIDPKRVGNPLSQQGEHGHESLALNLLTPVSTMLLTGGAVALLCLASLFELVMLNCLYEVLRGSKLLARLKGSGHSLSSWEGKE